MSADLIIKAASIITMEPSTPRAQAVAVDTSSGAITAVGTLAEVQASAPGVAVTDLGTTVLMPGFIDPHNHPVLSGAATQEPSYWISTYMGYPAYSDVQALWKKVDAELPAGQPVVFNGLDRLLQGAPELTNTDLDTFFPTRPAVVLDNSGHEAYFNSAVITALGWPESKPPADPEGSSYGRNADGTSNGRAYEMGAIMAAVGPTASAAVPNPLLSAALWYKLMAEHGITMTSEHTYQDDFMKILVGLASVPDVPLRLGVYHVATESTCGDAFTSPIPTERLWKQGIKLWADGSPWVGTIAASFPYLDTPTVRNAQIPLGPGGEGMLNYSRAQLDVILATHAPQGWQFAFHVNGDIGLDVVLDAYEHALAQNNLLGTDHRWRVEHVGACRGDQFQRAAALGVTISMLPAQFIYWGDILDGTMFATEIGSQWVRGADAFKSGAVVTFHNDGSVSPPIPLLNVQAMVTRRTASGELHGANQAVGIEDAFKAHTINAAYQLRRDHDLGSIKVGKLADFVELSADPYMVDSSKITEHVKVRGTWSSGRKIDLSAFITQVKSIDPSEHKHLAAQATARKCC